MVSNKTQNLKDLAHERKVERAAKAKAKKVFAAIDREDKAAARKWNTKYKKDLKKLGL